MHISGNTADTIPAILQKRSNYYESNRNCQKDRRSRQSRDPQGDPQNNEDPGGRPVTDNIEKPHFLLLFIVGSCQKIEGYIMQSDENFPQVSAYFKGVKWEILEWS